MHITLKYKVVYNYLGTYNEKKTDEYNMYCNWDRGGFISEFKTFVTSYHCLIFFSYSLSNELKKEDNIRNAIVALQCVVWSGLL